VNIGTRVHEMQRPVTTRRRNDRQRGTPARRCGAPSQALAKHACPAPGTAIKGGVNEGTVHDPSPSTRRARALIGHNRRRRGLS